MIAEDEDVLLFKEMKLPRSHLDSHTIGGHQETVNLSFVFFTISYSFDLMKISSNFLDLLSE